MAQAEQEVANSIEERIEKECLWEGSVEPVDVKKVLVKRWYRDELEAIKQCEHFLDNSCYLEFTKVMPNVIDSITFCTQIIIGTCAGGNYA